MKVLSFCKCTVVLLCYRSYKEDFKWKHTVAHGWTVKPRHQTQTKFIDWVQPDNVAVNIVGIRWHRPGQKDAVGPYSLSFQTRRWTRNWTSSGRSVHVCVQEMKRTRSFLLLAVNSSPSVQKHKYSRHSYREKKKRWLDGNSCRRHSAVRMWDIDAVWVCACARV